MFCRYGGIYERGSKEYTLDDFYSLQLDKLDRYICLKESGVVIPTEGDDDSSCDEDDGDEDEDDDESEDDDWEDGTAVLGDVKETVISNKDMQEGQAEFNHICAEKTLQEKVR